MDFQDFWNNYKNEILLIVATAIVTIVFSKLLPWIWQNLILNPFMWIARRVSRRWKKRGFEIEYLNSLIEDNKYLQVRGLRMQTVVSPYLESIFIPLQATASLHANTKEQEKINFTKTTVSASEMINDNKRIVILGDPGSGKTTLMRYLALNYARLLRSNRYAGDKPDLIRRRLGLNLSSSISSYRRNNESSLPVYISFRSITLEQLKKINLRLENLVFGRHLEAPDGYLEEKLRNGKCIFFLDGLDEVPNNERNGVVDWVEDLVCTYPDNKYIVTSRVAGYTNSLASGFITYKLEDFSNKDIEGFVKQWYLAVETSAGKLLMDRNKILDQAKDLTDAIFENKQVRLLAVNPLLLSIIALVHRARVRLPEKRVDLYDECTVVLLGYWDQAKGLFGKLQPSQKRAILESVAYDMQMKKVKEITTDDLMGILEIELPKYGGGIQDAIHFLEEIKERSGLLVERGANLFSFSHLTFQEYLVARWLTRTSNGADTVIENIRDDQWHEVVLLFCGMQDPSRLIEHIMGFEDDMFYTWSALAGQCVADALFVSENLRMAVIDKLIKIAKQYDISPLRVSMMKICSRIDQDALIDVIESEFRRPTSPTLNFISDAFSLSLDEVSDELIIEFLENSDLRLPILRSLSDKREISDQVLRTVVENLSNLNEKEKTAFIQIVENHPRPIGLDILQQSLIHDDSYKVRADAIKIIGKQINPKTLTLLGLSILDASGMVISQVVDSFIDIINDESDATLLRLSRISSWELFKNLRIKDKKQQSALALVLGFGFGFGILLIRSVKFLKINLNGDRKDFLANTIWSICRGVLWIYANTCKIFLFQVLSRTDLNFWMAYYQSIMRYSLDDPHSSAPFRNILPSLSKKYLDFLGGNLFLLNNDYAMVKSLVEALVARVQIMDDIWGLVKAMDSLGDVNQDLALSLAIEMSKSPLMPIRGTGVFGMYAFRQHVNQEHLTILANAVNDETLDVRQISAWAVGEIKELQTKETILKLLKDEEPDVLSEIIDAVGQIGLAEYVDDMRPFLYHKDSDVRDATFNALRNISMKNKITIPVPAEND